MIQCDWVLMNRRRTSDYRRVLIALKREARKHNLVLNPKKSMFDFELAAMNAFRLTWPGIKVRGCLFHFGQSLIRKL